MNESIREVEEVRLVGDDGEQVGILRFEEALERAQQAGLDLVEVAAEGSPPVCKIMDYGRYRFELEKKLKKQRRGAKRMRIKEIQLRPKTEEHDYQHKKKRLIRFLQDGHKAKLTIRFRGREMQHTELGREILDRLQEELQEYGEVEVQPKLEGYRMSMILAPK